jgi:hypothetical protein
MNERAEIRPSRGSNVLKMLGLMALLVPASGAAMIYADDIVLKALGALGLAFFGGGGTFALWSMTRTPWTLALAPDALEVRVEDFIARIPWRDIEAVGLANVSGQKMPSIRLARYDNTIASLSPEVAHAFERRWGAMKWVARATMVLAIAPSLAGHANSSSIADVMRANRALTGGYDMSFAWNQIDRPAAKFAAFLEDEWRRRQG